MKRVLLLVVLAVLGCGGASTPAPVLRTLDVEAALGPEAMASEPAREVATGDAPLWDQGKEQGKDVGSGDVGKEQPDAGVVEDHTSEVVQEVFDAIELETDLVALEDTAEVQCSIAPEVCNWLDDDCDGLTDEDLGWITCGVGSCARMVEACKDGVPQECKPGTPKTEVCNGLDDDCDGEIDDGLAPLVCGIGPCQNTVPACVGGIPQVCTPLPGKKEICNGIDDDCDGQADNLDACPCPVYWRQDRPYMFCEKDVKWKAAREMCHNHGYHLVTISDKDENAWVAETALAISDSPWWIGLNDQEEEGQWVWEDGEPVVFTAWHKNEPNDWWGEDCVELLVDEDGTWNDADCDTKKLFVCEFGQ